MLPRPPGDGGYLNRPERDRPDAGCRGWLRTGDIGHVDDDGYFYVVDRVKELIKYKGLQVAPAELEAVLVSHPGIADAAVVRVPDEEAGEVPKAFVVATAELSAQEVMDYVAERVAPTRRSAPSSSSTRSPSRCRARSCGACSWSATGRRWELAQLALRSHLSNSGV